ncbi:DUF6907 domain-containing protein [Streptomyces sp. NPDC058155]|uniref:DUF6907 domain-containing protein n=1 Tax=Streptomyces sp. NPDC058155 TaxID=3346359 RepID=UPI0036F08325
MSLTASSTASRTASSTAATSPAPLPHQPAAPAAPAPSPTSHPTPCPSWCRDRHAPLAHSFGPTSTWHWSPRYVVDNPRPLDGGPSTLLCAELVRSDEDGVTGGTSLYFQAEGDIDLSADEADIFIAQAQAWVDTLRVLRRQMS